MEYFSIKKTSDRVFRITDPFGSICTLIIGSRSALLADTGIGFGNIAKAVENFTDLPVIAVNTHEHLDHSMGGRFFDKVYMHP
ncbi:MAG: MBL fold metallo-hydrolase, partial [Oscillospiraceae bacterium]|nr:MBL fold metallo-hydrolase [Oscillospiraceae bacterium]